MNYFHFLQFFLRLDLDQDHYGLEKLKKRVIEYLAVRKLKNSLKGNNHNNFYCLKLVKLQ